ncbi:Decaprenyl-diphosphate synthase subunit 2, partial [Caligus rogercresseyi]
SMEIIGRVLSRSLRGLHISQVHIPKRRGWDRCLSEAEKLVGFPSSFESLSAFMTEDVSTGPPMLGDSHPPITPSLPQSRGWFSMEGVGYKYEDLWHYYLPD